MWESRRLNGYGIKGARCKCLAFFAWLDAENNQITNKCLKKRKNLFTSYIWLCYDNTDVREALRFSGFSDSAGTPEGGFLRWRDGDSGKDPEKMPVKNGIKDVERRAAAKAAAKRKRNYGKEQL